MLGEFTGIGQGGSGKGYREEDFFNYR